MRENVAIRRQDIRGEAKVKRIKKEKENEQRYDTKVKERRRKRREKMRN